jgi:hypothetical protein
METPLDVHTVGSLRAEIARMGIQGEQASKQYAGIRALIESHRAQPFSGDEYDRVIECLRERRTELLKTVPDDQGKPLAEVSTITTIYTRREPTIAEPVPTSVTDTEPPAFQVGFGFAEERPNKKRAKSDRMETQRYVALLEQLAQELIDARRPDGSSLADMQDVKDWLEQKIRSLRDESKYS